MKPISIDFAPQELNALRRLIAQANDHPNTSKPDRQTGTWIVERIMRRVAEEA